MKKTWKGIRQLVNFKNPSNSDITQTNKSIPISFKNPTTYLKNRIPLDFIIVHTTEDEILKFILSLESKSTCPSSIPVKLLNCLKQLHLILFSH